MSCNMNGFKANGHTFIEKYLHQYHCVCFQETKLHGSNQLDTINFHLAHRFGATAYKLFVNDTQTNEPNGPQVRSGGVTTYIHRDFPGYSELQHLTELDVPNRYQVIRTNWDNVPIYIHNVYAPATPSDRPAFFATLPTTFPQEALHVVHGDFNIPMNNLIDSTQLYIDHNEGKAELVQWLGHLGVIDAWRLHHPDERLYSSPTRRNRLDYVFISDELVRHHHESSYRTFDKGVAGDHATATLTLKSTHEIRGKSYWQLPRELLNYENVRTYIIVEARSLLEKLQGSNRPDRLWHGWKKRMKTKLKDIHRRVLRRDFEELKHITDTFGAAQLAHQNGELDLDGFGEAERLYIMATNKAKQHHVDTNFDQFASTLETSSAHFFRRPIEHLFKVPITQVDLDNGGTTGDTMEIQSRFQSHWGGIMGDPSHSTEPIREPPPERQAQYTRHITRRLSPDQRTNLEADLTPDDLKQAIKHMNPYKSPGPDGFPAGFFQIDPDLFAQILCKVFKRRLDQGIMMPHQRNAAVTLLFKKGSRSHPGNYRPIALIPVEVKIVSKALAYRLGHVLPDLIHPMQKGFVPGRSIHDHIHLIRDLQHHCTKNNDDAYATFLDFEKAFDRVNWSYLWTVLETMNFGPKFIAWVKLMYNCPTVQLIINNQLTTAIHPKRGVRQGDPLSSQLFILTLEPLGEALRRAEGLGVRVNQDHVATSMFFADDSTLFSHSLPALEDQLALVEQYCQVSGAALNRAKSKVLPLNSNIGGIAYPNLTILQPRESIKYLGVLVGHQVDINLQAHHLNDKFLNAFIRWFRRARTLQGRKLMVHTQCLSLLWHITATTLIPTNMLKQWQQLVNKFILGRKYTLEAKYTSLIPYRYAYDKHVGLGVPQIIHTIKKQHITTIQRLCKEHHPNILNWTTLPVAFYEESLDPIARRGRMDFLFVKPTESTPLMSLRVLPSFWLSAWKTWTELEWPQRAPPWDFNSLLHAPLWLSNHPLLQIRLTNDKTTCLGYVLRDHRRWVLWYIEHGYKFCLHDILTTTHTWPTLQQFADECRFLAIRHPMLQPTPTSFTYIYRTLTNIFQEISSRHPGAAITTAPNQMPFVTTTPNTTARFPNIKKSQYHLLLHQTPTAPAKHPFEQWGIQDTTTRKFLILLRRTLRPIYPVVTDIYIRMMFKLIPVQSRFWFLQTTNPNIQLCPYNCLMVETEEHAFYTCPHIAQLWAELTPPWHQLGVKITWGTISRLDSFTTNDTWTTYKDLILKMLLALICNVMHLMWRHRCNTRFREASPPHIPALVETALDHWCTQIRLWLRDPQHTDHHDSMHQILALLFGHPKYVWFARKRPYYLAQRTPIDFSSILT